MVAFFNRNMRLAHLYGGYGGEIRYQERSTSVVYVDTAASNAIDSFEFYSMRLRTAPHMAAATRIMVIGSIRSLAWSGLGDDPEH